MSVMYLKGIIRGLCSLIDSIQALYWIHFTNGEPRDPWKISVCLLASWTARINNTTYVDTHSSSLYRRLLDAGHMSPNHARWAAPALWKNIVISCQNTHSHAKIYANVHSRQRNLKYLLQNGSQFASVSTYQLMISIYLYSPGSQRWQWDDYGFQCRNALPKGCVKIDGRLITAKHSNP